MTSLKMKKYIFLLFLLFFLMTFISYSYARDEGQSSREINISENESFRAVEHTIDPVLSTDENVISQKNTEPFETDNSNTNTNRGGSSGGGSRTNNNDNIIENPIPRTLTEDNSNDDTLKNTSTRRDLEINQDHQLNRNNTNDVSNNDDNIEEISSGVEISDTGYSIKTSKKRNTRTNTEFKTYVINSKNNNSVEIISITTQNNETEIDFSDMEIIEDNVEENNFVIVKGLDLNGEKKDIKLRMSSNNKSICIKDQEISSINEISSNCDEENEYILNCNLNNGVNGYSCSISDGYYIISGLSYSGVKELDENFQQNKTQINTLLSSNIMLVVIIFFIMFLIVVFILFLFIINKKENKNNTTSIVLSKDLEEQFKNAENYIESHKINHNLETLISTLKENNYDNQVILKLRERYNLK